MMLGREAYDRPTAQSLFWVGTDMKFRCQQYPGKENGPAPSSEKNPLSPFQKSPLPRILALDGGGVQGLGSLIVLRKIMQTVGHRINASTIPLPSEHFDLISGTGAGGIIAILLGRLRMVSISQQFLMTNSPLTIASPNISTYPRMHFMSTKFLPESFQPVMINAASIFKSSSLSFKV